MLNQRWFACTRHDSHTSKLADDWLHKNFKSQSDHSFRPEWHQYQMFEFKSTHFWLIYFLLRYLWPYRCFVKTHWKIRKCLFSGSRMGLGITYLDNKATIRPNNFAYLILGSWTSIIFCQHVNQFKPPLSPY